jgi:hypothetical protein
MTPDPGASAESTSPAARRAGTSISVPIAVLLVLATAGGSGYLGAHWAAQDLRAELALRPPVVLFDLAGAVRNVAPERLGSAMARVKERAARLGEGGFLVLDAQAVIAASPDLYLDPASPLDTVGGAP